MEEPAPSRGCFSRSILILMIALLLVPFATGGFAVAAGAVAAIAWPDVPANTAVQVAGEVLLSRFAEHPAFPADPVKPSRAPICKDVSDVAREPLTSALGLMRGTDEGKRLYEKLRDNGVCIRVATIEYNSGYTHFSWTREDGWAGTEIVVDSSFVRGTRVDVLAALLVHEATHVERAVDGTGCWFDDSCTDLSNGVQLEEEVAAHGAEARWWIEAYGSDGKQFAWNFDQGENQLVKQYLRGAAFFNDYVKTFRSDPRDGAGEGRSGGASMGR